MTNRKPTGGSIIDTIHQKCLGPGLLSPLSLPRPPPIRPGKGGRGRRSHFVSRSTSTRHLLRRHLCLAPQPRCHSHWLIEARHVETRQHPPFPPLTAATTNTIPQRLAVLANTHLCSSPSMSIDRETVGGRGGLVYIHVQDTDGHRYIDRPRGRVQLLWFARIRATSGFLRCRLLNDLAPNRSLIREADRIETEWAMNGGSLILINGTTISFVKQHVCKKSDMEKFEFRGGG